MWEKDRFGNGTLHAGSASARAVACSLSWSALSTICLRLISGATFEKVFKSARPASNKGKARPKKAKISHSVAPHFLAPTLVAISTAYFSWLTQPLKRMSKA